VIRSGRPSGNRPLRWAVIALALSIVVLLFYLFTLQNQGSAMLPTPIMAQEILDEKIAQMETEFNVTLPAIRIVITENKSVEDINSSAYYHPGTIELLESQSWSPDIYSRIITHELGHHYLRSLCNLDWPNELPIEFEEAFVEGYTIQKTNVTWNYYETYYNDFAYMPREFFTCGFETCDPLGCYEDMMGVEWT